MHRILNKMKEGLGGGRKKCARAQKQLCAKRGIKGILSHLVVAVVARAVGEIHVLWISRNGSPPWGRIKSYIHVFPPLEKRSCTATSLCFFALPSLFTIQEEGCKLECHRKKWESDSVYRVGRTNKQTNKKFLVIPVYGSTRGGAGNVRVSRALGGEVRDTKGDQTPPV